MQNNDIPNTPPALSGFQTESQILPLLGVSRRTLKNWRDKGLIPFCRLPGSRLVKYHWPSVAAALLRNQKGAAE
jgi:predicted site-specific integrase-resolvase